MPQYSPAQVAQQVLNQGGSKAQAWVAAALVDGIESSGDTTAKNPSSTACGLFQFLTTTWLSNGGGAYAPTACQANWEQQIQVFLNASAGNNFYPWAPDLGGSYNGNAKQPAATAPQPGSPVANRIASLSAGGSLKFLGNVPTNWADAGAAAPVGPLPIQPVGGSVQSTSGGPCQQAGCFFGFTVPSAAGILLGGGHQGCVCLMSQSQWKAVTGAAAIAAGLGLASFGVIMLAAYGYDRSGAKQAVNRTARTIGIGTSLFAGQPELAAGIAATSRGGGSRRSPARPRPASSTEPRTAGRLESADIERQYRETVRQQGPIGPRGGSATSQRVRERQRRGASVPGPGRPRTPEQVRRARERAAQPF